MQLRTDRLLLRPATPRDLEPLHRIFGDPRAMGYWSTPPHRDLDQTREWLDSMLAIAPGEGEDFIVEFEGAVIGKAGLYRFPEVGFIFHPDHWGRGFANEALRWVLDRAFKVHRLDTVKADVDPRNEPSLRLLTRLGFCEVDRKKRTWFVNGQWCDSVFLSLDSGSWRAAKLGA